MIARLRGILIEKSPASVVIEVGGVGYLVEIPLSTFEQLPLLHEEAILLTEMIVREDALLLYGFASEKERLLFRLLLKVNGIGAKLALSVLSSLSVEQFVQAIQEKSLTQLQKISGIGKKTAERMILEMTESTKGLGLFGTVSGQVVSPTALAIAPELAMRQQVIQALESLGYKTQEAQQRVEKSWVSGSDATGSDKTGSDNLSDHIKRALQMTL
jgi:Holliday junction DNA helicase RuvA